MKIKRILCIALLISLIAVLPVSAQTEKDLPTNEELTKFLEGIPKEPGFISTAANAAVKEHPTWPWDKWTNSISFYYENVGSPKGYGSIYFDDTGKKITPSCVGGCELLQSHTGLEKAEKENKEVKETKKDTKKSKQSSLNIVKEQKTDEEEKLDEFMKYFENKDSVSLEEIRAHAKDVFFGDV